MNCNKRCTLILFSVVLVLSTVTACAPPANNTQKGAIYGGLGGAAAGAIVGQAIGHDTKSTVTGAAIGAALGGATGAGVGYYMDRQEEALRNAMAASDAASIRRTGNVLEVSYKSDLLFDINSAAVHSGAYADLDSLARVLVQYPDTVIYVAGHTDSTGSENYNLTLSQRRAEAVRQLLIQRGVSPSRIIATGYGETMPRAGNNTASGRQMNRRVEIRIQPAGGQV